MANPILNSSGSSIATESSTISNDLCVLNDCATCCNDEDSIFVDTLVVGNGPSALVLSYLLHGNTPFYDPNTKYGPYPDHLLHTLLNSASASDQSLYDSILHNATLQQYLSYAHREFASQVVAPVNYLLDTLDAPNLDLDIEARAKSRVRWSLKSENALSHLVVGSSFVPGGQWAGRDVPSRTLSYAEMLSLPGFSFSEFYRKTYGKDIGLYTRPIRADVAAYYASYPAHVGISDSVYTNHTVLSLRRSDNASKYGTNNSFNAVIQDNETGRLQLVSARNIVLATGVFTHQVPPDPVLTSFVPHQENPVQVDEKRGDDGVLIIGSGFSAADAILSSPEGRPIIHLFKWDPKHKPSPLRACHRESYPEYVMLYKLMRTAANKSGNSKIDTSCLCGLAGRYEGFANARILEASTQFVKIGLSNGMVIERRIAELKSYVGRIGVISYLSSDLRKEIGLCGDQIWASKHSLSKQIASRIDRWTAVSNHENKDADSSKSGYEFNVQEEYNSIAEFPSELADFDATKIDVKKHVASYGLEVADGVFVVGSLVGDTLVRYALGGCVTVAGNIIERKNFQH
ncbi:hypothetical protein V1512DRAFT_19679 [Lipomyces arxii]|uniref:uncharacterized protein n=1 Tax=Lipomyces arxii TaxID=56418 RepID=UPI0034CE89A4